MNYHMDNISKTTLQKIGYFPFRPVAFLANGTTQTAATRFWPQRSMPNPMTTHILALGDGDAVKIVENRSKRWPPSGRIFAMLHGLTGSHASRNLERIGRRLLGRDGMVIRMNFRNCGPGLGLSKGVNHSGRSEDVRALLTWLKQKFPTSPVTLLGFSMGANIGLKMAGEDDHSPTGNLDSLVAICPPLDLTESVVYLKENRFFDHYFVRTLLKEARQHTTFFPEIPLPLFPKNMSLQDFDDCYTAPRNGFLNAHDYYEKVSSIHLLPAITIPTLILGSVDDPIVYAGSMNRAMTNNRNPSLDFILSEQGGHLGFIGNNGDLLGFHWMDNLILHWLDSSVGYNS